MEKLGCSKEFENNTYTFICGKGMKGANLEDINKPLCNDCEKKATKFIWTDYNCEGCGIHKMLRKREEDGKLLCKKCSKNKCIKMFK